MMTDNGRKMIANEQFLFVIINFFDGIDVCFMVFKATFNNISVI
jgi:hypothetical protein